MKREMDRYQRRMDLLVGILGFLVAAALAGLVFNVLFLILLPLPLMIALLMFLATMQSDGAWDDRPTVVALVVFNGCSLMLWVGAFLTVGDDSPVFGGLPINTGLLIFIGWPFYTLLSGPLYAFCLGRNRRSPEWLLRESEGAE